jgi:hypothetical protein
MLMETISFMIKFGDTTDPKKVAKKIAADLEFCEWMLKKTDRNSEEDGVAAVTYTVEGWSTPWL